MKICIFPNMDVNTCHKDYVITVPDESVEFMQKVVNTTKLIRKDDLIALAKLYAEARGDNALCL